jgi:hypothetical protein
VNAKPNFGHLNRKPPELGTDARKQGGQPPNMRREKERAIKRRSSLTLVGDNGNSENSLATHIADVFEAVRARQNDLDPLPTIEACSHRPAEYADRNVTLSILIFGNYGTNVLRSYVSTMICSIAHRSQRSGSHERTKICFTSFTLLLDHFLQMLADPK